MNLKNYLESELSKSEHQFESDGIHSEPEVSEDCDQSDSF